MHQQTQPNTRLKGLSIGIALVQVVDIVIHAATNQLEPIRVVSNIVILLWLALLVVGRLQQRFLLITAVFMTVYLALNGVFLATNGLMNAEQGGSVRVMLLLLVILTVALSMLLIYFFKDAE